jgi:hypothetical protein
MMGLIMGLLVGADWNHGILNDFPYIYSWEWNFIIPFFRGVGRLNPPTRSSIPYGLHHDLRFLCFRDPTGVRQIWVNSWRSDKGRRGMDLGYPGIHGYPEFEDISLSGWWFGT